MTLEEAKKILEKEFAVISLHKSTEPFEFDESGWIEHEKPSVLEAFRVLSKGGYYISISGHDYNMREKRLKKEYEENTKAPGSAENHIKEDSGVNPALKEAASQFNDALLDEQGKKIESLEEKCKKYAYVVDSLEDKLRELKSENRRIRDSDLNLEGLTYATRELKEKNKKIDEQNKEITRLLSLVEKKENSISRLYYEKSVLEKENEDLKKGEIPARYFDKALVDEQAEKIKKLEHEKLDILEIASSSKQTIAEQAKKINRLGKEISKLNIIIHDKNAVLSDVAEELRLSKIREKNLAELGLKYVGENEKLKKKLADKVVDKIDAQALKSAESALAYKEKVIAEKDEVIADLGNELAATKKELEGTNNLVRMVRNASKEYCEYGIAAEKMIQKLSKIIVSKGLVPSDVFEKCRLWAKGYRFNPQLPEISEEEEKKLTSGRDTHPTDSPVEIGVDKGDEGGDYFGKIVICGKDFAKILKENEEAAEELFKVLDDVIEFMSVESKQLFEGDGIPTKMEVMEPSRKFKKR